MNDLNNPHDDTDEEEIISKSQLKREAQALIDFARDIAKLSSNEINMLPLPDDIRSAIEEAQRIKSHSALKRQFQYLGKLFRHIEVEPVRDAYDKIINHYVQDTKHFHRLEQWRDKLINEGDKALGELLVEAPMADRQHIRQLLRQATKEKQNNKPPRAARELFKYLKTLFSETD